MPTYVIGHRNPDTDAICSAIGYAALLNRLGQTDAEPACCGEVSARTVFALERAGLPLPRLVVDVRPTAGGICRKEAVTARDSESLLAAMDRMRQAGVRSLPVLGADGVVRGLFSVQRALDLLLPSSGELFSARLVRSSLERIASALGGEFQNAVRTAEEEDFLISVAAYSAEQFSRRLVEMAPGRLIVVAGDRPTVQSLVIARRARALVVTGGNRLSDELASRAREAGVAVLLSPHDTATTTLLMKCAQRVGDAMQDKFVSFPPATPLAQLRKATAESGQQLFPVLDEAGRLAGVFSRSDLVAPQRARLVLVDHNELSQAVAGAAEAEIVEVLDHHRVGGGLVSSEPIRFLNEPVGSTCTLVAREWKRAGLEPGRGVALCLAAGIISDTLHLTSPTTTETDREMLAWLEEQAGADMAEFAREFFAAGSALQTLEPAQAIRADCKEYCENGWRFAVAQIEEQSLATFWPLRERLEGALEELRREAGLDLACLLITDITRHHSLLLACGAEALLERIDYPKLDPKLHDLPGIVSRKKQLLPHLIRVLHAAPRREPGGA